MSLLSSVMCLQDALRNMQIKCLICIFVLFLCKMRITHSNQSANCDACHHKHRCFKNITAAAVMPQFNMPPLVTLID